MPQNLFPLRLRYPQTRQTIVVESFVGSCAVSSAACSASASAARRCTASSAAARASGPGLGRRISGCSPRYRSSSSEPRTCESDGKPEGLGFLLSSSTNRITPFAGAILAQLLRQVLSAGKLDLAFRLRRHTIARCRTISPHAHGLQDMAVAGEAPALKNERAVNAPIGSNNEADFYCLAACRGSVKRIRSGQGLGWLNICAGRPRADVGHIDELGVAGQGPCNLAFALLESSRSQTRRRGSHSQSSHGQYQQQNRRPGTRRHSSSCELGFATGLEWQMQHHSHDTSMPLFWNRLQARVHGWDTPK